MELCEEYIFRGLDEEIALDVLDLCNVYNLPQLRNAVVELVKRSPALQDKACGLLPAHAFLVDGLEEPVAQPLEGAASTAAIIAFNQAVAQGPEYCITGGRRCMCV